MKPKFKHNTLCIYSVLHSVIYGASHSDIDDHSHEHVFLGEYATNVLNMSPKELEDMLFWLVSIVFSGVQTQGNVILFQIQNIEHCFGSNLLTSVLLLWLKGRQVKVKK